MSKEGEQLSSSVIHRLEMGSGAVTVSAVFRYAAVLGVKPLELFDFPFEMEEGGGTTPRRGRVNLVDDPAVIRREAYKSLLPVYSLKAAAGHFGQGHEIEPEGWIQVDGFKKLDRSMFVARVVGRSMEPKIADGSLAVFRANPTGTRQGKIVLAQYRGPADPDTGGSYTIKVYHSVKVADSEAGWKHQQVTLSPVNPDFEPIVLTCRREGDVCIVAEYLGCV